MFTCEYTGKHFGLSPQFIDQDGVEGVDCTSFAQVPCGKYGTAAFEVGRSDQLILCALFLADVKENRE